VNVLVVSHSCAVETNQRVYGELEQELGHVDLVIPGRWFHEHSRGQLAPRRSAAFAGRIFALPVLRPGSVQLHAYAVRAARLLRRLRPEVLYIEEEPYSLPALQWATAARRAGVPAVFYNAQNLPKRHPAPVRSWERQVWRSSVGAVCVTETVRRVLRGRGFAGRSWVIPLSVDTSVFRPAPPNPVLRERLGLRRNVVSFLGRLVAEKGVLVALEAHRRLGRLSDTSLLCIGGGPLAGELRGQEGVVVLDETAHSDVHRLLPLSDVLVMPSLTTATWKEQFGRAAIEAMACGVPVVGSDSGEIPVILAETGGGVVVPEGDPDRLCEAISALLGSERRRRVLGGRGREAVAARFSTRVVASQLAATFEEVRRAC
jgi:glycosyltransferase involved in cell wall biosynthesis